MTETQRERVPFNDDSELDTALSFLRFARECILKKASGLSDEQLREVLVPTGTTLLWLVAHSTAGERYWFGWTLAGTGADDEEQRFRHDERLHAGHRLGIAPGSCHVVAEERCPRTEDGPRDEKQ